jgi:PAS domain S-box-containing protein
MGMIEDITERKQTEDKLYYQVNLLKDVSDAIISTDKQFNIRSWNLVAEQMYGYDASETIGKPTGKILNIEHTQYSSWEQVLAQINRCGVWRGEVIIRHKDNTPINVSVAISTIRNRAGIPHGYVAIHSDITKRKQAEHALQESENKFRTLTETMAAGVFIYQNTKLLYINPKMAHILGYSYKDLQQENGLEKIQVNFRKLLSAGKVSRLSNQQKQVPRYEIKTTTEQGEERWFDWIAGIIEYRGKPAVLGTVFDITAHKLAEIQLRQSEENLRQVVESMPVS